jgi:hypothetical protein
MGVSGQRHAPAAFYPREKDSLVPIVQEAGWAPEPVWTQRLVEKSFASGQYSRDFLQIAVMKFSSADKVSYVQDA